MTNTEDTSGNLIISQARELLSSYLDGEVTAAERDLVENAITQSPQLQRELETLRQTVKLFTKMPRVPAPRPFTLSEADVGIAPSKKVKHVWLKWAMGGISTVAVMAIVLAVGVTIFNPSFIGGKNAAEVALAPAPEMMQESAPAENSAPAEASMAAIATVEEPAVETAPAVEMMKAAEVPAMAADSAVTEEGVEGAAAPLSEMPFATETESMAVAPAAVPPLACDMMPAETFLPVWRDSPALQSALGCPTEPHPRIDPAAYTVATSFQPFERGVMIWSDHVAWYPQPIIYVLLDDGTYHRFDDTFNPETDAVAGDELPPDGLVAPVLGFGKVWRINSAMRDALGWATAPEQSGTGEFQMFERGEMLSLSRNGQIYAFLSDTGQVEIFGGE